MDPPKYTLLDKYIDITIVDRIEVIYTKVFGFMNNVSNIYIDLSYLFLLNYHYEKSYEWIYG